MVWLVLKAEKGLGKKGKLCASWEGKKKKPLQGNKGSCSNQETSEVVWGGETGGKVSLIRELSIVPGGIPGAGSSNTSISAVET